MNFQSVENIANAVLYEGYMLYPYRASSVKNRQRFNWGAVVPQSYSEAQNGTEAWEMQTQCLAIGTDSSTLTVKVRFLRLTDREVGKARSHGAPDDLEMVRALEVSGELFQAWQEAVEKDIELPVLTLRGPQVVTFDFAFPATRKTDPILDSSGLTAGAFLRTQAAIYARVRVRIDENVTPAEVKSSGCFKITVTIQNTTEFKSASLASRDDALLSSLVSTHTILGIEGGEFVSLIDPPEAYKNVAPECKNIGTYPVLAGSEGGRDCILSSPIILYDHPEIAPESAGNLFDGTEIDEILTLRIMTMTDAEKREMRSIDDRARAILERTEIMPNEQLQKMHGAVRGLNKVTKPTYG
ncbi:MAG: hypothetical protein ACR2IH_12250 [Pyrinomonadaceae bacterium]